MLAAATLLLALLAGAGADRPLPAESPSGYQCRLRLQPKARHCAQACRASLDREDAVFECVAGCTTRTLDALAACRSAPAAAPTLAVR